MTASIVLLHGFTGHASSWDAVVAMLPGDTRVFRPCLFGHEPRLRGARVESFEDEVDRIAAAVRAEHLAGARLAGYSMGARVALGLLVRHPDLFSSAVLFGVHPGLPGPPERASRRASDDEWAHLLEAEGITRFVDAWELLPIFATQSHLPADVRDAHRARRIAHDAGDLAAAVRVLGLGRMPCWLPLLSRVAAPVRLVAGARDPKFTAIARDLAAQLPHAEVRILDGCGHDPLVERPAAAAAALTDPLDQGMTP